MVSEIGYINTQISVCMSVSHKKPSASKNQAYLLISQMPISHHANQPPCPPPQQLCQLAIIPSCPAFATSKPFLLVSFESHHKTIDTNEKAIFQGFILALTKNIFLSFTPSKLGKTCYFWAFSFIFQTGVTFFWLMPDVILVCHFEA